MNFEELRKQYPNFIYEKYEINELDDKYELVFTFSITGLTEFKPVVRLPKTDKVIDRELFEYLVFHIGLIELVSYFKCTCSPNVEIKAGYIDNEQVEWFKKLYYYGLGEFMYVNNINCPYDELMNITVTSDRRFSFNTNYTGNGNMIAIGGGKDSCVSLNLLKGLDNTCFMINPKVPGIESVKTAGYDQLYGIERVIDKNLLDLNSKGFLNGHTPFSAAVAFISYLAAYLNNRKYIVLSNEGSANEPTVLGTKINHQYSKTFEFESDFNNYTKKFFNIDIKYFSLLRCLSEFQIGMLFSQYKDFHHVFKSCNVGSKSIPWKWCCNCAKCLFVYIILSPFIPKEEMVSMFGEDMYENESLLNIFIELCGYSDKKPFECVGTYSEVRYAVSLVISKGGELPFLLKYFKDNYPLELEHDFKSDFNDENNIPEEFINIVKEELDRVRGVIND
jgi:hypothetical protein